MSVTQPPSRAARQEIQSSSRDVPELTTVQESADPAGDRRRRQVHFWLASRDYIFLRNLASRDGESMANLLRRIVRSYRNSAGAAPEKCA